ncbi:hypothetical protein C5167_004584 [Papaver somniferum]|uniref:Uncharacterized protein n=1 Tax=Papaver somniferum TaxID=3469 RepID=A0A4Y7JBJ5_PAPSO|nr:hypothetical protein C5167_004584 [Papaver somniferum]
MKRRPSSNILKLQFTWRSGGSSRWGSHGVPDSLSKHERNKNRRFMKLSFRVKDCRKFTKEWFQSLVKVACLFYFLAYQYEVSYYYHGNERTLVRPHGPRLPSCPQSTK